MNQIVSMKTKMKKVKNNLKSNQNSIFQNSQLLGEINEKSISRITLEESTNINEERNVANEYFKKIHDEFKSKYDPDNHYEQKRKDIQNEIYNEKRKVRKFVNVSSGGTIVKDCVNKTVINKKIPIKSAQTIHLSVDQIINDKLIQNKMMPHGYIQLVKCIFAAFVQLQNKNIHGDIRPENIFIIASVMNKKIWPFKAEFKESDNTLFQINGTKISYDWSQIKNGQYWQYPPETCLLHTSLKNQEVNNMNSQIKVNLLFDSNPIKIGTVDPLKEVQVAPKNENIEQNGKYTDYIPTYSTSISQFTKDQKISKIKKVLKTNRQLCIELKPDFNIQYHKILDTYFIGVVLVEILFGRPLFKEIFDENQGCMNNENIGCVDQAEKQFVFLNLLLCKFNNTSVIQSLLKNRVNEIGDNWDTNTKEVICQILSQLLRFDASERHFVQLLNTQIDKKINIDYDIFNIV